MTPIKSCFLCQNGDAPNRYIMDRGYIAHICTDCEKELLIESYIALEDKILLKNEALFAICEAG